MQAEVFGETPKTAVETTALPKKVANDRGDSSPQPERIPAGRAGSVGRFWWCGTTGRVRGREYNGGMEGLYSGLAADRARPHPDLRPLGEGTSKGRAGSAGRVSRDGQSDPVKVSQTCPMGWGGGSPSSKPSTPGKGTAEGALGGAEEWVGTGSQTGSNQFGGEISHVEGGED
jgi:hypothetical protein